MKIQMDIGENINMITKEIKFIKKIQMDIGININMITKEI